MSIGSWTGRPLIPSADNGLADGDGSRRLGQQTIRPRTRTTLSYSPTACQSPHTFFPIVDAHPATEPAALEAKVSTSAQPTALNPLN